MKEARYFFVPDAENQTELPTDEAMHAMRVLRLKSGDELFLMDGVGNYFRAQVTVAATHHCYYEILEKLPQEPQWKGHLHLGIAPTKMMDRMEWMMEKATEVGIDEVSFLNCKFSERRLVKLVRLDKIVTAAVKQSHKAWKPQVNEMVHFNHAGRSRGRFLDRRGESSRSCRLGISKLRFSSPAHRNGRFSRRDDDAAGTEITIT